MSEAISAMQGARFDGLAVVEETGLEGMITLRGDLAGKPVKAALKSALGLGVPEPGQVLSGEGASVCWMSPDELLILCAHAQAGETCRALSDALAGGHHLVVNVSDARASFRISGAGAREALAKLCPVDFAPAAFAPGTIRRTRMAQIAAAVWMEDENSARVVCFRSVGAYAFGLLKNAAHPAAPVGFLS